MDITKVQIHINRGTTSKVKAWADIIIDGEFIVKGLAIREDAKDGYYYVTMPYKVKEGRPGQPIKDLRADIAHPINEGCRKYIEDTVLDEYDSVLTEIANARDLADEVRANAPSLLKF